MVESRFVRFAIACLGLAIGAAALAADARTERAERAFQRGRFGEALQHWQTALPALSETARIDALIQMAAAYQALGQASDARRVLDEAHREARRTDDMARQVRALGRLSDHHLLARQLKPARGQAEDAVNLARQTADRRLLAQALTPLGNVAMAEERYADALQAYREGLSMAADDPALTVDLRINAIHAHLAQQTPQAAPPLLTAAVADVRTLPDSYGKAFDEIALGHLAQEIAAAEPAQRATLTPWAHAVLSDARKLAETLQDSRLQSYAAGHLGELYAAAGRYPDAGRLWRRALFHAERSDAPELLARWYWQSGRALRAQGKTEAAKDAYRQALRHLGRVRPALLYGYRGKPQFFRDTVAAIYLDTVELLLREAGTAPDSARRRAILRQVRDVMEGFKTAELKNYFQDECVAAYQDNRKPAPVDDLLAPGTASLYPIVFPDRLVLLISLAGGDIDATTVAVTAGTLRETSDTFRKLLAGAGNSRRLLVTAQALHRWLIEPVLPQLRDHRVDTLIVVPDGVLRTIPFAALHDGQQFLVEQYALGVTPGLTLTDAGPSGTRGYHMLFGGLSESVQDFPPLPYVVAELDRAAAAHEGTQLLNGAFRKTAVERQLRQTPYTGLLFATHGQFAGDPRQSFLLAYDGRVSLDELERFVRTRRHRERPVGLLVLSACETAEGDERAALGLAGVAVKAGASSAVASLWAVNDASTAQLVPAFLANLKEPANTKAQALRQAQRQLLGQPNTRHPFHWASFVLVGNWF